MLNKTLILLAVTAAMTGCSSTPPPVVQKAPDLATMLTFETFSAQWQNVKVRVATNERNGCGEFSNDLLPTASDKDVTVGIEGGRNIFFHLSAADEKTECGESGFFYASKGNEYTLSLKTEDQQCKVSLAEKTQGGSQHAMKIYPAYVSIADTKKVCIDKDLLY